MYTFEGGSLKQARETHTQGLHNHKPIPVNGSLFRIKPKRPPPSCYFSFLPLPLSLPLSLPFPLPLKRTCLPGDLLLPLLFAETFELAFGDLAELGVRWIDEGLSLCAEEERSLEEALPLVRLFGVFGA